MSFGVPVTTEWPTLVALLRQRAAFQPAHQGYIFLPDGEKEEIPLTYAELDRRARAIAALLQSLGLSGQRALLVYHPGFDYIAAFFGCLYAGVVAVPTYPPPAHRPAQRLEAIEENAQARVALTSSQILAGLDRRPVLTPTLGSLQWITTDNISTDLAEHWKEPSITGDAIAFLQYTSGSTSLPRGVVLTHGNLLYNSELIFRCCDHQPGSCSVSWLPPYHDMGLIGGILQPLYAGHPVYLLPPAAFLQRPLRWLQIISRKQAEISAAPNFAYDLCVRKISPEQRKDLDLHNWRMASTGSEPVRKDTLDRFVAAFAACGFRREAFYPCYGLAEATLVVSGGKKAETPNLFYAQRSALEHHEVIEVSEIANDAGVALVSCGRALPGQKIVIADPETLTRCPSGRVGEIWIAGPSIAQGYWGLPQETASAFHVYLRDTGEGPFLRSEDLGFLRNGELFVTGRLKDLIIIRGRNHYPQDIELTAERSHPALRTASGAAFSADIAGEERLVVVYEVERHARQVDIDEVATQIRRAVAAEHGVSVYAVVLLLPGSIPKTSSGKVQRRACCSGFLTGSLQSLGISLLPDSPGEYPESDHRAHNLPAADAAQRQYLLQSDLIGRIAQIVHAPTSQIEPWRALNDLGLDSLRAMELSHAVELHFGVALPVTRLLEGMTVQQLAATILSERGEEYHQEVAIVGTDTTLSTPPLDDRFPLSPGQAALWFLHQLAPESTAYNITRAVRLLGEVDIAELHHAFQDLVNRHPSLRSSLTMLDGKPVQQVHAQQAVSFEVENASDWSEEFLKGRLVEEARSPFDLMQGPLLRVRVFVRSPSEHVLLLSIHHIIADFWSLSILTRELEMIYSARRAGHSASLPALSSGYGDYVRWMNDFKCNRIGAEQREYWRGRLARLPAAMELPVDHIQSPSQPTHMQCGASYTFRIEQELCERLKTLSKWKGVTLNTVLLAGFQALLFHYTAQEDILVGMPVAGRSRAQWSWAVGYFVNTLAIRAFFRDDLTFAGLIEQIRERVFEALEHQDYPFSLLVEQLQPTRPANSLPLLRTMFAFQQPPPQAMKGLTEFALDLPESSMSLDKLMIEALPIDPQFTQFDLRVMMAEVGGGLAAAIEYSADLFEPATIERLARHYQCLLEAMVTDLNQRVGEAALLPEGERQEILVAWNATGASAPELQSCLHELFEEQARRTPENVAVVCGDAHLTYDELEQCANKLARYLQGLGVGPEVRVGVCLERSLDLVVGLLGVLKAGGAYVPLDPAYPLAQLAFMADDAAMRVFLTQEKLRAHAPTTGVHIVCLDSEWEQIARQSKEKPAVKISQDNLAYVIYTSGSTGIPKGVQVVHRGLVNLVFWHLKTFAISAVDKATHLAGLSFDASAWELWPYLAAGASVFLVDEATRLSPAHLWSYLDAQAITVCFAPTPLAEALLRSERWPSTLSLRILLTGGDMLHFPPCTSLPFQLVNNYGTTENTVVATSMPLSCDAVLTDTLPPIGYPITNTQVYILDAFYHPVPVGVPGELYIGGKGLARGYLGRAALTAEKFIPHPFSGQPGDRLYRTGDRVRYRSDGSIEFLGRLDEQVKVRGFRVEPGEVEAALGEHPQVRESVAVVREDEAGEKRLMAYVVLMQQHAEHWRRDLRSFLRGRLPEYMLPSLFEELDALPLTPNGKIDRRALPAPTQRAENVYAPPRNPVEQELASIWEQVLGVEHVSIYDDFFEMGGHSLLATQVIARLHDTFHLDLPLRVLFECSTLADLADSIQLALRSPSLLPPSPAPLPSRPSLLPLSFAQERLWFLDRLLPNRAVYTIPAALRLSGPLQLVVLQRSLNELVLRHETLRTTFLTQDGHPTQVIAPSLPLPLPVTSLRPGSDWKQELKHIALEEAQQPFDLARGPLIRTRLLRLKEEEHILLLIMHHIVSDGWSLSIFLRELTALYQAFSAGLSSPLPVLPIQYADFASWQRAWLQGEVLDRQLAYWRQQLSAAPAVLALPTDHPHPAVQSFKGASFRFQLSHDLSERLQMLSRREGVTLFMCLLAAFQTLLFRYSGQADVLVGVPIANRRWRETEGLIGFFVNTLVLRTDLTGDPSFGELLQRVREVTLAAYDHQDLPFEKLVEVVQPERNLSHTPLFQVMFTLQDAPSMGTELAGLRLEPLEIEVGIAKFDLTLSLTEGKQGLAGVLEYSTDLFEAGSIERMAVHFQTLLEGIVADSEQRLSGLPILREAEKQQLLVEWNEMQTSPLPSKGLPELFEEQVALTPEQVAVVDGPRRLTYEELNVRANQLARFLRRAGVGLEARVGICLERSWELVMGIVGILKAGGAYVPLDPSYPAERLAFMLADAGVSVLLTRQHLVEGLPAQGVKVIYLDQEQENIAQEQRTNLPGSQVNPDHLAYVMYTSGSTGTPKGIGIPQRAISRLVLHTNYIHLQPDDKMAQASNPSFDAATFELWGALLHGAQLVIIPKEVVLSPVSFARLLHEQEISVLFLTTALFNQLAQEVPYAFRFVRCLLFGGEAVEPRWVREVLEKGPPKRLVHVYGPTESTTFATWYQVQEVADEVTTVPIGQSIANTQAYLLDEHLQLVPVGVPGELYLGGAGLARGYFNHPALTAERFIPHPFSQVPGSRLYKTGDLARYKHDGNIEFLGRRDHQVKIRGFRVEPGEIEAVLSRCPAVREIVVVVREDVPGDKRLIAYVVSEQKPPPTPGELRDFVKDLLPGYMVPSAFVIADALPLTSNGKVDRRRLPAPSQTDSEGATTLAMARTPVEEILVSIWEQVLGVERISIYDNFFEIGGHSLLATQVISRLRDTFQVEVPLRLLFESPTVVTLAAHIELALRSQSLLPPFPLEPCSRDTEPPLSFAQERLWFLDHLVPNSALYNIPATLPLSGPLHMDALERSLARLVLRHESLRTTFAVRDGCPVQVIAPSFTLPLSLRDLRNRVDWKQEMRRVVIEEVQQPFDLASTPPLRACLLRLDEEEHVLLLTMHHIVTDGWSMGIIVRELAALYEAFSIDSPCPLPELPIQYADFASWQRSWLQGEVLARQLAYWREHLAGAPAVFELPTDYPRPSVQSFEGAYYRFLLPKDVSERLEALSRREGVTLFMTLLAAFQTLLFRYTGQADIVVGSPIANRRWKETEGLIGFFVNTLALRANLAGNPSFRELLGRVREVTLAAYDHQDLPFEKLVEDLRPERSMSHNPLFQVMFALQNAPGEALPLLDSILSAEDARQDTSEQVSGVIAGAAKFDLSLFMEETDRGLLVTWEYSTDLFDVATIKRWSGNLRTLLHGIVVEPDQVLSALPLLTDPEREQLLVRWNHSPTPTIDDHTIQGLFEAQAKDTPEATAVVFGNEQLTYGELEQRANQFAHYLQKLGVGPEVRVGVCLERSPTLIVCLLAILKAGGAYVPFDPNYPQNRLAYMLEDAQVEILLTQQLLGGNIAEKVKKVVHVEGLWEVVIREPLTPPAVVRNGRHLAYVLYTSGSTGYPKGVALTHQNAVSFLHWVGQEFSREELAKVLASTSICFDLSVFEIFGPLVWGGCVMLAEDTFSVLEGVITDEVTLINTVPSIMVELLGANHLPANVRWVNLAGESLPLALLQRLYQREAVQCVRNLYGPSETTTYVTCVPLQPDSSMITIGRPITNAQLYILDAQLQPLPVGIPGELYIGGPCLARGYLNRPGLTAERFLPHPFSSEPGDRLYKTGDVAKYLADGRIEFLGRRDEQVKVQGVRIELGEIEAVLQQQPGVQQCAVVVQENERAEKKLVAYVVCIAEREGFSVAQIRHALHEILPRYMVPSTFIVLDAMPLTSNGKVDRSTLSALEAGEPEREEVYVAPRNSLEQVLVGIWTEVLGLERIGVHDNFFSLGGDSLSAIRIISRVRDTLGVEAPLRSLFEEPTIANLALAVKEQEVDGSE